MGQLEAKKQLVAELKEKFTNAQSIVVVDYTGVNAKQTTNLRKNLREAGVDYIVTKNTLFKRAAEESGYSELADLFTGVTAVAFCAEDVIAPANIICKFIKDEKVMTIKGGAAEGKVVSVDQINVLGTLPGRETLLAQVAMCFKAPLQKVCFALEEIRKKAEAEGEATA